MTKAQKLKKMALDYGFDFDLVNPIKIEFTNASDFGFADGQKLGKYLPIQNKIKLYDTDAKSIFPTYCHELVHALQRQKLGLIPYFFALTFLRKRIEKDAYEMEDRIYDRMQY
jgi:hypothetical protein